jgi:DNA-directed RNA polymerase specialized sigma24 family protein
MSAHALRRITWQVESPGMSPVTDPKPHLRLVTPLSTAGGSGPLTLPRLTLRHLIQIRIGDDTVRETFFRQWERVIQDEARHYAARGGQEEELRAEGGLALWEAALQYDPQRHTTTPARYVRNHIHRNIRRAYRDLMGFGQSPTLSLEMLPPVATPERRYAEREDAVDLDQAVQGLATKEREQFNSYLYLASSGHGPDEAARILAASSGESYAAWKKRIARVRRKVRQQLAP